MMIATLFLALVATTGQTDESPVILDFTASWCGPCQQMRPVVDQLVQKRYPIKAVDFDTTKSLVNRYKIMAIPTFVAIAPDGRELGRVSGYCPAGDLVGLYKEAKIKLARDPSDAEEKDEETAEAAPKRKNPLPWETVVRIRIINQHMQEFGSGTVIYSSEEESIILTCAHIFKVGERGPKIPVNRFNLPIEVHLFDGQLHGTNPAQVHERERVRGEAIDYDFNHDVGLIRIRPGRKLAASPVVPAGWTPRTKQPMTTVGCSESKDATAWSTWVTKPLVQGAVADNPGYEATECAYAPKQGRSGGGLYTLDGMLAGVCDFAEPTEGHGLYASPRVIHKFLDRNNLTVCYNPEAARPNGPMVAQNKPNTKVRAQSASDLEGRPKKLTIPPPEQLNVPAIAASDEEEDRPRDRRVKSPWTPEGTRTIAARDATRGRAYPSKDDLAQADDEVGPRTTEMKMQPGTNVDPFDELTNAKPPARSTPKPPQTANKPRPSNVWRAAVPAQADGGSDRVNR